MVIFRGRLHEDTLIIKDATKGVDKKGYLDTRLPTTSKMPEKVIKMVLYKRHRRVQASVLNAYTYA